MKKNIISIITLSILTSSAFAAHNSGAYVEANVGGAYASTKIDFFGTTDTESASAVGANANLGYQFNRFIAAEVGYTYYGNDIDASMGDVAVKAILPITDDFSLFGKLGAGYIGANNNDHGSFDEWAGVYGIGAAYAITPSLDVNVQFQGATIWNAFGDTNIGLVSGGLTYHFD